MILCLALGAVLVCSSRVSRVGNAIQSSLSGVDLPGATFLINDIVLDEGVLFAFRAYFRSDKPLRFQIWRPVPNAVMEGRFRLISDTWVIPSVVNEVEDIYLVAKQMDCAVVRQGDRLGLSFEDAPGAVAYTFDASDPKAFGKIVDPTKPPELNVEIQFDTLQFPYDFSVAAYVDTDLSRYDIAEGQNLVSCPNFLLIPDVDIVEDLTPLPPVVGVPGSTGATGPTGPAGERGPQGVAGDVGPEGSTGATGPSGPKGSTGSTGPIGATGPQGLPGTLGATGPTGDRGERGPQGPAGPPGPAGGDVLPAPSSSEGSGNMMNYILMAWIGVLTILIIVLVIVAVVLAKRRRAKSPSTHKVIERMPSLPAVEWAAQQRKSHAGEPMMWDTPAEKTEDPGSETSPHERPVVTSGHKDQEDWMGTLKSNAEMSYSSETLNVVDEKTAQGRDVTSGHEDHESWMGTLKSNAELSYSSETINVVEETTAQDSWMPGKI